MDGIVNAELDNPVIKPDSTEEAALLEASRQADAAGRIGGDEEESQQAEATPAGDVPTDEPKAETDKVERPRDAQGRFTKTETGEDIPEDQRKPADEPKSDDPKPETPYSKAQRDKQRRDDSWQALNREKEQIRAYERQLKEREQQLTQPRQQQPQRRLPYSSMEMANAANDFEKKALEALKDADYDAHGENLSLAQQAREQAAQIYQIEQQEAQQTQREQHQRTWVGHMQAMIQAEPDLGKPGSALSQEVQKLLSADPIFGLIPDGFKRVADMAKQRLAANSASELRETNKKLQAEVDRLNGLTGIRGSGPTAPPQRKDFDNMPLDQQLKELERASANADAGLG